MSLKEAKMILAYARKRGLHAAQIDRGPVATCACKRHNPADRGEYAVLVPVNAWRDGQYVFTVEHVEIIRAGCLAAV